MMKKILSKFFLFLFGLFAGLCILLLICLGLLQTQTAQTGLLSWISSEAQKNGYHLTITGFEKTNLLEWSCQQVSLEWGKNQRLEIDHIHIKIALLPLFKAKLTVNFLQIEKAHLFLPAWELATKPFTRLNLINLPFNLSAKTLKIKLLQLTDLSSQKDLCLQISGKANIQKDFSEIQANLLITELSQDNTVTLSLVSSQTKNTINAKANLDLKNSEPITNYLSLPWQAQGTTHVRCWGKWNFWSALKYKTKENPLFFVIEAQTKNLIIPKLSFLDRAWSLQTEFSLWPDLSSSCENCILHSNWLQFLGKIELSSSFLPLTGSAVVKVLEIAELQDFFPFTIQGAINAKLGLRQKFFLFSADSSSLLLGKQTYSPATLKINAEKMEENWQGKTTLCLQNKILPWEGSCSFDMKPEQVDVSDILLQAGQAKIAGTGHFKPFEASGQGSFFILAPQLKPFRLLFPNSDLEGKIGGRFFLSYANQDVDATAHLLVKNARYQSSLVDTVLIEVDGKNLTTTPSGFFQFTCENLLTKSGHIAKLFFTSQPTDNSKQEFSLKAYGNWKKDFTLESFGTWKKDLQNWNMSIHQLEGLLFNLPFSATPFSFGKEHNKHFLDQFFLNMGEGSFSLNYELDNEQLQIDTQATHLPLNTLSVFYPNLAIQGFSSFQGSFFANPQNSQGYLIGALEEASLANVPAKGSLQIHVTRDLVQVFTHLYAAQNQFLDSSLSLPITYYHNPFQIKIDTQKPLSGEITMQGAIEDLLSFIKATDQKISGWATCHQLLSGSLQEPKLQGELSLQNGTYENYRSGTSVKNAAAQIISTGSHLQLTQSSAQGLQGGSIQATGHMQLSQNLHFPFSIATTLTNLELIDSDMLKVTASGPITIVGDTNQAKAFGNLTIEKSTFSLAETLPGEIPTLPLEYVNKPVHLQRSEMIIPTEYPFKLDFFLSADHTVSVKGKGLDSLWTGNLQVTGTPANVIGKGSLTLEKGEFKFSGKTFTLMQGELSFSDKPDQQAYLKIVGQVQMPSAMIIATMQGPLTSPRLTFHSNPSMPTSSILSFILFNKDISEISPVQAIQLAQVIMSLSGAGGPDVLEAIRKSLGVDRLNIVGKDGTDEISVQIGWYLTHGITVSLSQSASSSDITVEVDLKHGFIFEAETQNQEEGKFSLKWNCNY